jgi:NAD(P)-dependent dehydrogenase (short-subunit alcohol dehydrogenase family)
MSLEGKIAIITGAARGIGAATVSLFVERGATVIACDKDAGPLDAMAVGLREGRVVTLAADVTEEAANSRLVDTALDRFGRLDVAFLNAGIAGELAPTHEYPNEVFDRVMRVNSTAVFFGLKHAIRAMLAGSGGSIICTSSVQGLQACGYTIAYTASKHAVMGMVRTAALEYARHNIRVNAVNPGTTDTEMMKYVHDTLAPDDPASVRAGFAEAVPMGRYARPDEIARTVAFLASDDSAYVTGTAHVIAGGMGVNWAPPMQVPAK